MPCVNNKFKFINSFMCVRLGHMGFSEWKRVDVRNREVRTGKTNLPLDTFNALGLAGNSFVLQAEHMTYKRERYSIYFKLYFILGFQ